MAKTKKQQSEPTTETQETNFDSPEIVNEKVAPETSSASTAEETTTDAPVETINSIPVEEPVVATVVENNVTVTEVLPPVAETKTVEVETVIVPVVEEKTVVVDKEFLYRMLVGLSRGHTNYYTYSQVTGMIGKLFYVDGTEKQAKWDEIKEYIQKR
jgi:hypothetical protein